MPSRPDIPAAARAERRPSERFTLRLSPADLAKLRALADLESAPASHVVRALIRQAHAQAAREGRAA